MKKDNVEIKKWKGYQDLQKWFMFVIDFIKLIAVGSRWWTAWTRWAASASRSWAIGARTASAGRSRMGGRFDRVSLAGDFSFGCSSIILGVAIGFHGRSRTNGWRSPSAGSGLGFLWWRIKTSTFICNRITTRTAFTIRGWATATFLRCNTSTASRRRRASIITWSRTCTATVSTRLLLRNRRIRIRTSARSFLIRSSASGAARLAIRATATFASTFGSSRAASTPPSTAVRASFGHFNKDSENK